MYPHEVHTFLLQFFKENNCEIKELSDVHMKVQLTIEMDKKIMNRPFYWQYVESVGDAPNPAELTFVTDYTKNVSGIIGEIVYFGSPRLSQLIQATKDMGAFVQVYEQCSRRDDQNVILTPWLGVNYKVSYYSDRTKEKLYSLGMNLMTGAVFDCFQESLHHLNLATTMRENTFNLPYVVTPKRALEQLDKVIDKLIQEDDHCWADEARKRWKKDERVLEYFYEGQEARPACYEMEKQAMAEQYEPKIKIDILSGGLFYLK